MSRTSKGLRFYTYKLTIITYTYNTVLILTVITNLGADKLAGHNSWMLAEAIRRLGQDKGLYYSQL